MRYNTSKLPNEEPSRTLESQKVPKRAKVLDKVIPWVFVCFIVSILVILIVPAIMKVQEKLNRTQSAKNLKQIGKAFIDYNEAHGHLPPAMVYGKDSQPLLSWRVLLLPFLGEEELYSQFKLDEAWDSPNNKPLLAKMPLVYTHPTKGKPMEPYGTYYQVFVGGGGVFEPGPNSKPLTLNQIDAAAQEGHSQTLLVIEAGDSVQWTKPEDLLYASDRPLPKLGSFYSSHGYLFVMADGSVHGTWPGMPEDILRRVIPWNKPFLLDDN
jgi:hypothetical protein